MKGTRFIMALVLMLAVAFAGFAGGSAERAAPTEPGEIENNLVLYTSIPTAMVDAYTREFNKLYPNVNVSVVNAGTGELLQRIRAESGRPQADILWGGFPDIGASARDLMAQYQPADIDKVYPEFVDPLGYNIPYDITAMIIMYNRDLAAARGISEAELPRRWRDLGDPRWRGEVVQANPPVSSTGYTAMVTWLELYGRDDAGWSVVEDIARNMIVVNSSRLPYTQVGNRENLFAITWEEIAFRWSLTGTTGIIYPEDGMTALPGALYVVNNSPNPVAARKFADFALSIEAQQMLVRDFPGRRATRMDVTPGNNPAMPSLDSIQLAPYDLTWAAENRDSMILPRWQQILVQTQR